MIAPWVYSSLLNPRSLRWLECARVCLIMVFIETVIHGVFFPSDGRCEEFRTRRECIADQSKILTGRSVCNWYKEERKCETAKMPADVMFTLIMALVILVLMKPVEVVSRVIQEELCAKRPKLEDLDPRLITTVWLGAIHHPSGLDKSPLALAVVTKRMMDAKSGHDCVGHEHMEAGHAALIDDDGDYDFEGVREHFEMHGSDEENAHLANVAFTHLSSSFEEMRYILDHAERTLQRRYALSSTPVFLREQIQAQMQARRQQPQSHAQGNGRGKKAAVSRRGNMDYSRESLASARAIEQQLGIYADGTLAPLTLWQRLRYGSREAFLISKISAARKEAKRIVRAVSEIEVPDTTLRDIALIREFIMENIAFAYRIALRGKFDEHEYSLPEWIHPVWWAIGWLITVGAIGFFLYWVLAWGIINTGKNLEEWGNEYIVVLVQDICVIEVAKIIFVVAFALISARPQLHVIRQVINEAALSYIQHGADDDDDISIVQHFSPACRAAHVGRIRNLAAAAVLRQITDADYERCQTHKGFSVSRIALTLLLITATLASVNSFLAEQMIEIGLQTAWSAFLVGNTKLEEWNALVTILLFAIGGPLFIYYMTAAKFVVDRALRAVHQERLRRVHVVSHHSRHATRQASVGTARERLAREWQRAWHTATDAVVSMHIVLSEEYWRPKATRRAYADTVWEGLNRYALMSAVGAGAAEGQATVDAVSRHTSMRVVNPLKRQVSTFAVSARAQEVMGNIPPEVLAMRTSGEGLELDELETLVPGAARGETAMLRRLLGARGLQELRGDAYFSVGETGELDAVTGKWEEAVVYQQKARLYAGPRQRWLDVTTDKHVAMKRILEHLLGPSSSQRLSSGGAPLFDDVASKSTLDAYGNTASLMVSEHELLGLLTWVFTVYHPCRLPLAEGEVHEVLELHRAWHAGVGVAPAVGHGTTVARVPFALFEGWFLRLCAAIERLRVSNGIFEGDADAAVVSDGDGGATAASDTAAEPTALAWSRPGTAEGKAVERSPAALRRVRLKPIPFSAKEVLDDGLDTVPSQSLKQKPLPDTAALAASAKVAVEAPEPAPESPLTPAQMRKDSVVEYRDAVHAILDGLLLSEGAEEAEQKDVRGPIAWFSKPDTPVGPTPPEYNVEGVYDDVDFDFDGGDDESDDENAAIDNTDHKEEYQAAVKAILRGLF